MNTLLIKPKHNTEDNKGKFENFNLTENPFPTAPTINSESQDKRYNGEIFESALREKESAKIISNFLHVP
jgi:hypothetical protein